MKRQMKEDKTLVKVDDGLHKGTIIEIEERTDPYAYIDFKVILDDMEGEEMKYTYTDNEGEEQIVSLKFGVPDVLSPSSMLGELLKRFDIEAKVGQDIDIEQLIGKHITFQTTTKKIKDREYANILRETVKPV